ncbi:unnamed protein product, partial [Prunus brigantina]
LLISLWFSRQWGTLPFYHRSKCKTGEQFGTPSGTSQYTYSHRVLLKFMNTGSSSQNPHHDMEINQVVLREGLESEESDARHSAHGSTGSRRSQDTLNNMTAMMQWQVNRQFRKDREAAMARIPNPDDNVGKSRLDKGKELFLFKNVRPQSGQKALHQDKFSRINQSLTGSPYGNSA